MHLLKNFNVIKKRDMLRVKRWIQKPFAFECPEYLLEFGLTPEEETKMLQLSSDLLLKKRHQYMQLSSFWISFSSEYPAFSKEVFCFAFLSLQHTMGSRILSSYKNKIKY